MASSVPGAPGRVNRPSGDGGQTKVGAALDRGRVDGGRARGDPPEMATRKRLVDAALIAFALVAGAALFSNQARQSDLPGWAVALGTLGGLAACAALWLRHRRPVAVTVAILPVAVLTSFAAPAGLIAFYTVALQRRLAIVVGVGALGLTTLSIAFALQASDRPELRTSLWLSLLSIVLLHIAVAALGMYVGARRELLASLRERAERAEAAQHEQAERARANERARIAREMHDVLAHRISLLSMHAGSLEFSPGASQADVARAAGVIRANAHAALEDLREVIGVLRAVPGDERPERPLPTLADVPELIEESRAAGMTIRTTLDAGEAPEIVGRNAYRIVQEGLTNARKHAPDTAVHVSVCGRPGDGLEIEVRNPLAVGRRNGHIPGAGAGLIGLAERAQLAGGRLEHGLTPAGEYRLWAWLPWMA
jgi:signal transduction histidine kinase